MNKILNYYIYLYTAIDTENNKPRVEMKRLWFLMGNLVFLMIMGVAIFSTIATILGRLIGVLG